MDVRDAVGEVRRQNAEAGPDLEHDVVRIELREPADHAEDVLVDEEVLAELLLRGGSAHGRAEGGGRVGVEPRRELGRVLAAGLGQGGDGVDDVRGLVRPPAARLRRQVGAVRLGEDALGGNARARPRAAPRPSGR